MFTKILLCFIACQNYLNILSWKDSGDSVINSTISDVTARDVLLESLDRPIDIVGIGDSNQGYQGFGWHAGMHKALFNVPNPLFSQYATDIVTQNINSGNGALTSSDVRVRNLLGWANDTLGTINKPSPISSFFEDSAPTFSPNKGFENIHQPLYIDYDHTGTPYDRNGIQIKTSSAFDETSKLRGHITYAKMKTIGIGGFVPQWRLDSGSNLITGPRIDSENHIADSWGYTSLDLYADSARQGDVLEFRFHRGGQALNGLSLIYYMRAEDLGLNNGISYSTWNWYGGQTSLEFRDMIVNNLEGVTDQYKQLYFKEIRRLQESRGLTPRVLFWISFGMNDRHDQVAGLDFEMAIIDMMNEIDTQWVASGGTSDQLVFMLQGPHPISEPLNGYHEQYRKACIRLATMFPNVSAIDVSKQVDYQYMFDNGWYADAGSGNFWHLSDTGYTQMCELIVNTILTKGIGYHP